MKRRSLINSVTAAVVIAILAPLSVLAAQHGFFYRAQCGQDAITNFERGCTPSENLFGDNILRASLPPGASSQVTAGLILKLVGVRPPKKGVGFQYLKVRAGLLNISPSDVFAVIYFTQGRPSVVPFTGFQHSTVGCIDSYTITSADLGTGSRVAKEVRLLARGSNSENFGSVLFGTVEIAQSGVSALNASVFANPVQNVCNTPQPQSAPNPE